MYLFINNIHIKSFIYFIFSMWFYLIICCISIWLRVLSLTGIVWKSVNRVIIISINHHVVLIFRYNIVIHLIRIWIIHNFWITWITSSINNILIAVRIFLVMLSILWCHIILLRKLTFCWKILMIIIRLIRIFTG